MTSIFRNLLSKTSTKIRSRSLSTALAVDASADSEKACEVNTCEPPKKRGVVLGAYAGERLQLTAAAEDFNKKTNGKLLKQLQLATGDKIKQGKAFVFYNLCGFHSVVVVGVPKQFKNENLENFSQSRDAVRVAAGTGCRVLKASGVNDIQVDGLSNAEAAAEGSFLATYKFQEYKKKKDPTICMNVLESHGSDCEKWYDGVVKANAQNIARNLMDAAANFLTPSVFAERAQKLLCKPNMTVTVHDKAWIQQQNMNAFLSVARGSEEEPKFLEIHYGNTKDNPCVLVGKGVTFDSGGICLKSPANMADHKAEMGGAAVIVAALNALSSLDFKANIVALIPLTENMPSGLATKPGDVFRASNGKSICVDNTDYEGRLILADALAYSAKFNPKWIINIATLTAEIKASLGNSASGVFSNSHRLYKILESAASTAGDRVWRFPLWEHYTKLVTSSFVDLNNQSKGRSSNSCAAAAFLREFIPPKIEWMHIDMYNVIGPGDPAPYLSGTSMTGRPTRTLIEFLMIEEKWKEVC